MIESVMVACLYFITPIVFNITFVNMFFKFKGISLEGDYEPPLGRITLFFMVIPLIVVLLPATNALLPDNSSPLYIIVEVFMSWIIYAITYSMGANEWYAAKVLHQDQCLRYNIDLSKYSVGQFIVSIKVQQYMSGTDYTMTLHQIYEKQDMYGKFNVMKNLDTFNSSHSFSDKEIAKFVSNYISATQTYAIEGENGQAVIPIVVEPSEEKVIVVRNTENKED